MSVFSSRNTEVFANSTAAVFADEGKGVGLDDAAAREIGDDENKTGR
ncbi:MAG TPA: hypothetical protein VKV18_02260 [Chthonomonas sp.]|nr:hypothetical protein [Chthonomonas sp.]HLI47502.1 hypothetical protein [Chthonomonas sp.]